MRTAGKQAASSLTTPTLKALAEEIAHDGWEQELVETWALERVQAGDPLQDTYPIGDARRNEYEEWRRRKETGE